jgi:hypothetical protein
MTDQDPVVNGWAQLNMFPRDVYEITLRIGVMPQEDHCQLQLEVTEQPGDKLIGLYSRHHCPIDEIWAHTAVFSAKVVEEIERVLDPFRTL